MLGLCLICWGFDLHTSVGSLSSICTCLPPNLYSRPPRGLDPSAEGPGGGVDWWVDKLGRRKGRILYKNQIYYTKYKYFEQVLLTHVRQQIMTPKGVQLDR